MAKKSFHYWLPEWVQNSLNHKICGKCSKKYSNKDIVAIGIRESESEENNYCSFYVEHKCSSCDYRSLITLNKQKEVSLENMCFTILEGIRKRKLTEKSRAIKKNTNQNPISDKEMKNFIKFVNNTKTHEEFLKGIGVLLPPKSNDSD